MEKLEITKNLQKKEFGLHNSTCFINYEVLQCVYEC